ncbi:hypothetical protein M3815_000349 [Campylobacter jejuni]|nr:hypothetical protein [Campylobacter jejuni]
MQPKSIILFFYGYILFFRRHYSTQGIDSIEKLSINNQDATEALKIILPFIMFSMLMGGASF